MSDDPKRWFKPVSSINNAVVPRGWKGWALIACLPIVAFAGAAIIQHLVHNPRLAVLTDIVFWLAESAITAWLVYRNVKLPSRGR